MSHSRSTLLATALAALTLALPTDPPASSAAEPKESGVTRRAVISCPATRVHAKATGEVRRVLVEEGSVVKAGEVLAEMRDAELEADLKLADAELTLAVATVKEFVATKDGKVDGSPAKEQLARLEAQVKVAEARLAAVKVRVAALSVRSPIAGVVGRRDIDPGHDVRKGNDLFTVYDLTKPEAVVEVPEREAAGVRKGQKCTVQIDAIHDLKLAGEVARVEPVGARERRAVRVYVTVQNPKDERSHLRPGMTGQVTFAKPE